ncbi:RluA family pseudouridine synthase [soil metagenome]
MVFVKYMANLEISRAQRLDQKVVELIPELSRASATKLIVSSKVTVNGEVIIKPGYKLREGEAVKVDFDVETLQDIPTIKLPILYEDEDCVVIIKPVGLLTHSKGEFYPEATVETWLRARTKVTGARAGIVHRLDRATSGVMICAKTPEALKWLQKQFAQRKTKKTYFAVVQGTFKEPEAIIDMPIERNPKAPATFRVGTNGKSAQTAYKVIATNADYSLVELKPVTGRTHQLRVHLNHLGHPIVGDYMYSGQKNERLMLHAYSLELTLPDRKRMTFHAPIPKEFRKMVS